MPTQKSFTVVARNQKVLQTGVKTSKGVKRFGGKSAMQVYDRAEAEEIKAANPRDVNVVEDERHEWHLKHDKQTDGKNVTVHHYTFGASRDFSNAWAAYERRRKRKEAQHAKKIKAGKKDKQASRIQKSTV